jgi:hypothetical protein
MLRRLMVETPFLQNVRNVGCALSSDRFRIDDLNRRRRFDLRTRDARASDDDLSDLLILLLLGGVYYHRQRERDN